ncbi:hypothetical protein LguiB_026786 [Lonicera macranthoides]
MAINGHDSSPTYCICRDGLSNSSYQNDIDYACSAGVDCSPISETGDCYEPNNVKDHCNYAVNSYFLMNDQAPGSCNFSGTATSRQTVPNEAFRCSITPSINNTGTVTPLGPYSDSVTLSLTTTTTIIMSFYSFAFTTLS